MDILSAYWSKSELIANGIILLHLLGSLAVGLALGYERSYHGRAAGMRTYALVCLGSTLLTVISGYPALWFGGMSETPAVADPTRVMQGIVTGIGFLGAGVIMKEGFTIRGLSTAASIWMTSAIGVVIGIGFYGAALSGAVIAVAVMSGLRRLESALPHQSMLHLSLTYPRESAPGAEDIRRMMRAHGFEVTDWTFHLADGGKVFEYQIVLQAPAPRNHSDLVDQLSKGGEVLEFRLSPSRN
jgi:putative Mg2+ transporter-C (MgtC) family protein